MPGTAALMLEREQDAALMNFRCRGCGNCCHLRIPVTHHDLQRIIEATGKKAEDIVEFVPTSEFRGIPDDLTWIRFGPRKKDLRVMCLQERDGHCMYLGDDCRCQGYAYRPVVCRTHPFILELDDDESGITSIEHNDGCECAGDDGHKFSESELVDMHNWSTGEDTEYTGLVAIWNRNRKIRSEEEFLRYIAGRKLRPAGE